MNITFSKAVGKVDVTVFHLEGELDGQSHQTLIDKAREVYRVGARHILIDLTDLTYMSSAGLAALHSVALIARGEPLPEAESGWSTFRSVGIRGTLKRSENVKLFNPSEQVMNLLETVGFNIIFDIFNDFDEAVNSF